MASLYPEALGLIELSSIVRGYRVLDDMVKRSPVQVHGAHPVSGGKFLIFVAGDVAEVDEAMIAGMEATTPETLVGELFLAQCHEDLWEGLERRFCSQSVDALGLIETRSVVDAVLGADTALKAAEVRLSSLHLANGIQGKAYFTVTGAQHDVEAAIEAATLRLRPELIIEQIVINRPHDQMTLELIGLETIHDKY